MKKEAWIGYSNAQNKGFVQHIISVGAISKEELAKCIIVNVTQIALVIIYLFSECIKYLLQKKITLLSNVGYH